MCFSFAILVLCSNQFVIILYKRRRVERFNNKFTINYYKPYIFNPNHKNALITFFGIINTYRVAKNWDIVIKALFKYTERETNFQN